MVLETESKKYASPVSVNTFCQFAGGRAEGGGGPGGGGGTAASGAGAGAASGTGAAAGAATADGGAGAAGAAGAPAGAGGCKDGAPGGAPVETGGGTHAGAAGAAEAAYAGFCVGVGTIPLEAFWRCFTHTRTSETVLALSSMGLAFGWLTRTRE